MPLPPVFSEILASDHVAALDEAIDSSVELAMEDLVALQRIPETRWNELLFLGGLPEVYRDDYTLLFAKKFLACLMAATYKLADPDIHAGMLSCVAEELSAYLVLRKARDILESRRGSGGASGDIDFGPAYDLIFEDTDFEMLFDPASLRAMQDPVLEQTLGVSNLRVENWFDPFKGHHVHPICHAEFGRRGRGAV